MVAAQHTPAKRHSQAVKSISYYLRTILDKEFFIYFLLYFRRYVYLAFRIRRCLTVRNPEFSKLNNSSACNDLL